MAIKLFPVGSPNSSAFRRSEAELEARSAEVLPMGPMVTRFPALCVLDLEVKPSPPMTYIACVLGARLSGSRHSLQCAYVAWTTLIPLGSQQRRSVLCRCPLRPSESLASWTHPPSAGRVILGVIAVLRAVDCGVGNVGPGPSEVPPLALPANCVG